MRGRGGEGAPGCREGVWGFGFGAAEVAHFVGGGERWRERVGGRVDGDGKMGECGVARRGCGGFGWGFGILAKEREQSSDSRYCVYVRDVCWSGDGRDRNRSGVQSWIVGLGEAWGAGGGGRTELQAVFPARAERGAMGNFIQILAKYPNMSDVRKCHS